MTRPAESERPPETGPVSDAEAIRRVLAGDVESFAMLVERYQHAFAAYATNMMGSPDEAADVMQESMVRAFRFLDRCTDPANFKAWLFRIVVNQCKTHLTRRSRRRVLPIEAGSGIEAPDNPAGEAELADMQRRVRDALLELPAM